VRSQLGALSLPGTSPECNVNPAGKYRRARVYSAVRRTNKRHALLELCLTTDRVQLSFYEAGRITMARFLSVAAALAATGACALTPEYVNHHMGFATIVLTEQQATSQHCSSRCC
jgi:hypothetical protein